MKGLYACAMVFVMAAAGATSAAGPGQGPGYSEQETEELAFRVSERVLSHRRGLIDVRYEMACARFGVLMFAEAAGRPELLHKTEEVYRPFKRGWMRPLRGHVDMNVFGIVPFELYIQTGEADYLPLAVRLAEDEYRRGRDDGLSDYTRLWVDDMWMVGSLQTQAFRATGKKVYADRAMDQLLAYCRELQEESGLFHHSLKSPHLWGRGNGWAAASMTAALLAIPPDHPRYGELMDAYKRQMAALIRVQHESGMWNQLLDAPDSYLESSCTGMFVFALASGVRKGWLGEEHYRRAAERGWNALKGYVDRKGDVRDVCVGTNHMDSRDYYMNRPRRTGVLHGKAAFLWAASAMYEMENE